MAIQFLDGDAVLGLTEADVYITTNKALNLLIQIVNTSDDQEVDVELWITNASNVHQKCVQPLKTLLPGGGVSDNAKHVIKAGYKIRGTASVAAVARVEVSVMEGVS